MLFCNILRINPQPVVQKLIGHKYTISQFAMSFFFAQVGQTQRQILRKNTIVSSSTEQQFEMATLTEDTARFLGSWEKYFQLQWIFLQYMDSKHHQEEKQNLLHVHFWLQNLMLPIIESSEERQKDYETGQLGF